MLPSQAPASAKHRINPQLTFDTLVPGRANQMARTAARPIPRGRVTPQERAAIMGGTARKFYGL